MSEVRRQIEAAVNRRVYEYVDGEGNIYYSFYKSPAIISPPTRLKLRDRVGTHLINFLVGLRRLSETLEVGDDDAPVGRVGAHEPSSEKP